MTKLAEKKCVPCRGGVEPLRGEALRKLHDELGHDWNLVDEHHLEREYSFPDFVSALAFVNRVGEMAEEQDHHPEIWFTWGKVKLTIWTHKIDGLTESDFVWAAKADRLLEA
jgi:4a-hydroxytetrahydrobiopterin dehydratase